MRRSMLPPGRRILPPMRMPEVHYLTNPLARQLRAELMDLPSSMRLIKTHPGGSRKLTGPVSTFQRFVRPDGGANQPETMAAGPPRMNARRLVAKTRGQSAGAL